MNLEGALTWAFEFEDEPYFAGFRALSTNQIDLPVLNVFLITAFCTVGSLVYNLTAHLIGGVEVTLRETE